MKIDEPNDGWASDKYPDGVCSCGFDYLAANMPYRDHLEIDHLSDEELTA